MRKKRATPSKNRIGNGGKGGKSEEKVAKPRKKKKKGGGGRKTADEKREEEGGEGAVKGAKTQQNRGRKSAEQGKTHPGEL